jgi:hypothetical protein
MVTKKKLELGDYIEFGSYESEPILWRVIQIDEQGDPLLWSDKILCLRPFDLPGALHETKKRQMRGSNFWVGSMLRQWLNSAEQQVTWRMHDGGDEPGFLSVSNFSQAELKMLKPVTHRVLLSEADIEHRDGGTDRHKFWFEGEVAVSNYDYAVYMNVTDYAFVLSLKQYDQFLFQRSDVFDYAFVSGRLTDKLALSQKSESEEADTEETSEDTEGLFDLFASIQGDDQIRNPYKYLWTCTPSSEQRLDTTDVRIYLDGDMDAASPSADYVGVRPALSLYCSELELEWSGTGVEGEPYRIVNALASERAGYRAELLYGNVKQKDETASPESVSNPTGNSHVPLKVGDYVLFGRYESMPIRWRIIHLDEKGRSWLFAEHVVTIREFDYGRSSHQIGIRQAMGSNVWADCILRRWLNSADESVDEDLYEETGFLHERNFTEAERKLVAPIAHRVLLSENDLARAEGGTELFQLVEPEWDDDADGENLHQVGAALSNYERCYYHEVTDHVFCLSLQQLVEYVCENPVFSGDDFERAKPTYIAIVQKRESTDRYRLNTEQPMGYWLNTPLAVEDPTSVLYVDRLNFINETMAEARYVGVRPALVLQSDLASTGLKIQGDGSALNPWLFLA